jgi:hypothetical protein
MEDLGHVPQGQQTIDLISRAWGNGLYMVEIRTASERFRTKVVVAD